MRGAPARLVEHCDPPAGVRIAFWIDAGGGHQAASNGGQLRVSEIRQAGIGADRAAPYRPFRCAAPEARDGHVENAGQVERRSWFGEQFDTGPVTVARDQPRTGVVTAFTRPVKVRKQAHCVAGALQVGDHGVYLEGEWPTTARVFGLPEVENPQNSRFGPAGVHW